MPGLDTRVYGTRPSGKDAVFTAWVGVVVGLLLLTPAAPAQAQAVGGLPLSGGGSSTTTAITDAFTIYGLEYEPGSTTTLAWDVGTQRYSVYGDASIRIDGESIAVTLGNAGTPGILIASDESVQQATMTVTEGFVLHGLAFTRLDEEDPPVLHYDAGRSEYEFTGFAGLQFGQDIWVASLGSSSNPGVTMQAGVTNSVTLRLNSDDLVLDQLTLPNPNVVLRWDGVEGSQRFEGRGTAYMVIDAGLFHASIGSVEEPGLVITGGVVDSLELEVIGGALLFGVLPTYDTFTLSYVPDDNEYRIMGELVLGVPFGEAVAQLDFYKPAIIIDAGEEGGILYRTDTKNFYIEEALFEMQGIRGGEEHLTLGGFELFDIAVGIKNNELDTLHASAKFPPGFTVTAGLGFKDNDGEVIKPLRVHSIDIEYDATNNAKTAIPIPGSGLKLVKLRGAISNLNNPAKATYEADVGFIYGDIEELRVLGQEREVAFAYFEADVIASAHHLEADFEAELGAYVVEGVWDSALGEAELDIDLVWGVEYVMAGMINLPSDPFLTLDAEAHFSHTGDVDLLASVDVAIPSFIPIIGGKHWNAVEGVMHYESGNMNKSFAAGWRKINLGFTKVTLGAKMNLGTGHIAKIGAGEAKKLSHQVEAADAGSLPYYACIVYHTFPVPDVAPEAYLQGLFRFNDTSKLHADGNGNTDAFLTLLSPDWNTTNLYSIISQEDGTIIFDDTGIVEGVEDKMNWSRVDSAAFIATVAGVEAYNAIQDSTINQHPELLLTPGNYHLEVKTVCKTGQTLTEDDFTFTVSPVYPAPLLTARIDGQTVTVDYGSYLTDSTTVSLHWNTAPEHKGKLTHSWAYASGNVLYNPGALIPTLQKLVHFDPGVLVQDTVWVYAMIDDRVNHPVYTDFLPVVYPGALTGTVRLEDGTPLDSATVMIRHPETDSVYVTTSTGPDGTYALYNIEGTTYEIHAGTPGGYYWEPDVIDEGDVLTSSQLMTADWLYGTFRGDGSGPITLDFTATTRRRSIYGHITGDATAVNGRLIPGPTSIPGIQIFLEDKADPDAASQLYTSTETGFAIYDVPPGNYTVHLNLPSGWFWNHSLNPTRTPYWLEIDVTIDDSSPGVEIVRMAEPGYAVYGIVQDSVTGENLGGVGVTLRSPDGTSFFWPFQATNEHGMFWEVKDVFTTNATYDAYVDPPVGYTAQEPFGEVTIPGAGFVTTILLVKEE